MATIVRDVLKRYRTYLQSHDVDDFVKDEFRASETFINKLLRYGRLEAAVGETASLYDFLDEHGAINPRTEYPGPGKDFKRLVDKYEIYEV